MRQSHRHYTRHEAKRPQYAIFRSLPCKDDMNFGRFYSDVYGLTLVVNESTGTALGCRWVGKARERIGPEKVTASAMHSSQGIMIRPQYPFYGQRGRGR